MRPRLLDLFCCEGGAGEGYARAGFDVTGIDLEPRYAKRYPHTFHAGDALAYVAEHGHEYDATHASPPCQAYSITKHTNTVTHPELIEPTRAALIATGKPYVIENVVGAPLLDPLMLCGSEFNLTATDTDGTPLRLERHRLFESNVFLWGAGSCHHNKRIDVAGAYGGGSSDRRYAKDVRRGGYTPAREVRAALLGIDWMTLNGMSQSIPPAYTEWIGSQLLAHITREGAA
jgi:DNA (cytosine-5)-methyltransferase 1